MELAEIRSAPAQVREVKETLPVSGVVQPIADRMARVSPRVAGRVVRLAVQLGDRVAADQTLAILESAELAQAQAEYREALGTAQAQGSTLSRQQQLAKLGQFGRPQVEEARTQAVQSERDVHEAEHHLAEERARLQQAAAERQVQQARWERARSLPELVSRQEQERIQGDLKKAQGDLQAAQVRVEASQGDYRLAQKRQAIADGARAREEKVFRGGFSTSRELVEAEAGARTADVRVQAAADRVRLLGGEPGGGSRVVLRAPIAGQVQDLAVTLGESVSPERTALTIVDLRTVWAQLAIAPRDLGSVRVGDLVELSSDGSPDTHRRFRGRVQFISASSDDTTRTVAVRARLENPDGVLKTGVYVRGGLVTDVRRRQLTVPDSALQEHTGRPTLYVALHGHPGSFEVRHVKLGARGNGWREISEGLRSGESVAVNGTFYLKSEALKSSLSDGCCGGD